MMRCFANPTLLLLSALPVAAQNQVANFQIDTDAQITVPAAPSLVPSTAITVEAWITDDDASIPVGAGDKYPSICRHTTTAGLTASYIFRVDALSTNQRNLSFIVNSDGFGLGAAMGVGYCDHSYFTRRFVEHLGMTPSHYRQRFG